MRIGDIKPAKGAKKNRKRVGRGNASGHGKTSGRGENGQLSRSGAKHRIWFEGGQMPLIRRVPKKGFQPPHRLIYQIVNVRDLNRFEDGRDVDFEVLRQEGLISNKKPVKLLGDGELHVSLKITVDAATGSAVEKVEKLGGKVHLR